MKMFRMIVEKIAHFGMKKYCSCGHAVSVNLPVCPYCGCRLTDVQDVPLD